MTGIAATTALFAISETAAGERGPVAAMTSTAGWASAARRVLGRSWIVTPDGVVEPDAVRRKGSAAHLSSRSAPTWMRHVPTTPKVAVKDVRQWRRAGRLRFSRDGPWDAADVSFVWQRHELFDRAGIELARSLGVPSVLFVPATKVWEAQQWGVSRPGWGGLLERMGERPQLQAADLVACGTDVVAEQARRLGAPADRILVTPTGVDLELFDLAAPDPALLRDHRLTGRFVVGWVGSFRRFHAVEQAVEAMTGVDGATILFVGDGPERPRIEELARTLGVEAVFAGTVAHDRLPGHLAAMDAALVLAAADRSFHYSPLKLAEYLAAGLPVVAPTAGQLPDRLNDGVDAVLVPPGDTAAIRQALLSLRDDPGRREQLGKAARAAAEEAWSWDLQIRRIADALR